MSEKRKSLPVAPPNVKAGDLMALIYYVKVERVSNNGSNLQVRHLDGEKQEFGVHGEALVRGSLSADQCAEGVAGGECYFSTDEGADVFRENRVDKAEFFRNWALVMGGAGPSAGGGGRNGVPVRVLTMSQQQEFETRIKASPRDEALRLVYADWLEEHGQLANANAQRDIVDEMVSRQREILRSRQERNATNNSRVDKLHRRKERGQW